MKTYAVDRCPGCQSSAATSLQVGSTQLERCTTCGLVYSPAYADPEEVYVDGYFDGSVGDFGLDTRDPGFREFLFSVARRRLRMLERVTGRRGRILDVGCGCGELLVVARERGWDGTGVDLVPDAVAVATTEFGLDVREALLEDSGLPERSFDAVSATHVLEHQHDGLQFLREISRWSKPGGHVFIEVPNWRSFDRRHSGDRWLGLRPLEHVAHYSPRTLAETMSRAGLEPVKIRTPSYQYREQTLDQALRDLGLEHHAHRLRRLSRPIERHGRTVHLPRGALRPVLRGAEMIYDRARVGSVVIGIGRVPGS